MKKHNCPSCETARPDCECYAYTAGYMGDPLVWCYYLVEYPDEGSVGPFKTKNEARRHAQSEECGL